ncbi:diguanylate cyclase [Deinococcus sp. HMF7604]|uniref:diguanylate cyclase n=1 Tax=Deinococcus betulae TaxID=2873312 RepID=UPI001CCC6BBE|nr:diguanylate cyclase [Deinococcus betulae]MBZ9750380.1 diguanylate cyclase [Deinococcus betulae]
MRLRRLLFVYQIPLWACLLLAFACVLGALDARVKATTQASQTRAQLEGINTLLLHTLDMETGVRGYVVAGDPVFLEPYREAVAALPGDFAALRQLFADPSLGVTVQANRTASLARIEALVTRWQQDVGAPEIEARQRSAAAAQALVKSQRGKRLLDTVRREVAALNASQTASLRRYEAEAVRQLRTLRWTLYSSAGLLLLLSFISTLAGANVLVRHLQALTGGAQRVTSGAEQITVPERGPAELRTLARTFNDMGGRLHAARQAAEAGAAQLTGRNDWMRRLGDLSDALQAARSLDEGARILERALPALLPGTRGTLSHHNASRNLLVPVMTWGAEVAAPMPPDHCWALRRGEMQTPEAREFSPGCPGAGGQYVCLPLFSHGETLGLLRVDSLDGQALSTETRQLLPGVARQVALALASLRLQDRLLQQSIRDPLTGLFNRRQLEDQLSHHVALAQSGGQPLSLLALDIDHFKRLNDTFGHEAGDAALVRVSAVLRDHAPAGSTPARPGGEEFALLLPGTDLGGAEALAERVRAAVAALNLSHAGINLGQVTVSLGVAELAPGQATPAHLTGAADQALYAAKRSGRNRVMSAAPLATPA